MTQRILAVLRLLVLAGLVLATACVSPTPPQETAPPTEEKPPEEVNAQPEELPGFPLTITDDLERTVEIEKLPQRIVSLAPSNTEILFALGLDDRIVGVTDYCDYPEAARAKPRVAGYSTPDVEKLVSLEPDLVLAASPHEKTVLPALEDLGLTVVAMSAKSLDAVLNDITLVGQINGKSNTAAELVGNMTQRIEAVTSKTDDLDAQERSRVFYVCWHDPIWTLGSETFVDDLIWKAGGVNIFADDFEDSRVVSLEAIVSEDPQVIIISGMGSTKELVYKNIKEETRLRGVTAIASNQVYKISDASLIERPGPRIVAGLEEVAKLIHPDIFGAVETEPK